MTVHLPFLSFVLGLSRDRRRPAATGTTRLPHRLFAVLRRPWQQQAPPIGGLNNHLRRDIGLPPIDERRHWP